MIPYIFENLQNQTVRFISKKNAELWVNLLNQTLLAEVDKPVFTTDVSVNTVYIIFNAYPELEGSITAQELSTKYPGTTVFTINEPYQNDGKIYLAAFQGELPYKRYLKDRSIEVARDTACYANVLVHGTYWQADKRSQELLSSVLVLASLGVPLPPVWRDVNNVDMVITNITELLMIAGAMANQTQLAYARSWQLKAQVAAVTTIEELESIVW